MLINYPLFNRKKDGSGVNAHSVEIAAFQAKNSSSSRGGGHDRIDVPIEIVPMTEPGTPHQELENCFIFNFKLCIVVFSLGRPRRVQPGQDVRYSAAVSRGGEDRPQGCTGDERERLDRRQE